MLLMLLFCVAALKKKNNDLKDQLEVLTDKHVTMQREHEELACSLDELQDSHAMLQIAHEVVLTLVMYYQLPTRVLSTSYTGLHMFTKVN